MSLDNRLSLSNMDIAIWYDLDPTSKVTNKKKYKHVIIEISDEPKPLYISFWKDISSELHKRLCPDKAGPHFHLIDERSKDTALCANQQQISYKCKIPVISKVRNAFEELLKNPNKLEALHWGIIKQPYPFNAFGLAIYLLQRGEALKRIAHRKESSYVRFFYYTFFLGAINAIGNLVSYFQVSSLNDIAADYQFTVVGMTMTAHSVNTDAVTTHNLANEILKRDYFRSDAQAILNLSERVRDFLANVFTKKLEKNIDITSGIKATVTDSKKQILAVSKASALVCVLSLGIIFISHRFLRRKYKDRDLELLCRKLAEPKPEEKEN